MWSTVGMPGRLSLDVVDGSGRIYVWSMSWRARQRAVRGERPRRGLGRRRRLAWGWLVSVPAGHAADAGLNVGGGKSESREGAEWNDRPVPQGLGVRVAEALW